MSLFLSICSGCGNSTFGDRFCTMCGLEAVMFPDAQTICPKCNTTRSINLIPTIEGSYTNFCGHCGYDFKKGDA